MRRQYFTEGGSRSKPLEQKQMDNAEHGLT